VVAGYRLVKRQDYEWPTAVVLAASIASTLLIAVITSAALPDDGKINNHFYPGYVIFFAPVWVMVGLTALRGAGWRAVAAAGAGAAALTATTWFVVESYTRPLRPLGKPKVYSQIDAPEPMFLAGDWDVMHLARVTVLVLGMLAVAVALLMVRRFATPAVLALAAAVAVNVVAMQGITKEMTGIAAAWANPQLIRDAGVRPGELVVCDGHVLARFNHQREVYWRTMPMIDLTREPPPPDATIVISPWRTGDPALDWDGSAHGFHWLAGDGFIHWAAWRRG
jgi:hypothetical protein